MTMANPYAPEALASTMAPQQSMMPPLVVAPQSLSQGLDLGQQAPMIAQPGPVGPVGGMPPPTVADPAALASFAPPMTSGGPPMAMPPPSPDAGPPVPAPALPQMSSAPPDANMSSAATGEPVVAPEPVASTGAPPAEAPPAAKPPPPKTLRPAGHVDPRVQEAQRLGGELNALDQARNVSQAAYAERTAKRADDYDADAGDLVRTRSIQNAVDATHAAKSVEFENSATAQTEKELGEINRLSKQVGDMKIDPKAAMPKTIMGNVFAALGAALGAGGAALTGGPNAFTSIMNHAIETQMRADEANISNARQGLSTKIGLYGQLRQQLGDKRAAALAYRKSAWDYADNQINALKEKATTRDQLQRYDGLIASVDKARLEDEMAFKSGRRQEIIAGLHADAAARTAAGKEAWDRHVDAEKLEIERLKAGREGKNSAAKEEREDRLTYVPGMQGYVSNPGLVDNANKVATSTDNGLQAIARIRALFKSGNRLSKADVGAMKQAVRALTISEKDRNELGQLTGGDWNLMALAPDDVERINRGEQVGALDELENFLRAQKANFRKNYIVKNSNGTPNAESAEGPVYIPDSLTATGNVKGD
jgi:hypothetical protein